MKPNTINIPFLGYKTHCIVYGDIKKNTPLIILHGGPGGCVERYEVLSKLSDMGIPVIMYDQLGSGYSKVPKNNLSLWTYKTYMDELENLIKFFGLKQYNILGHSWGGMLALEWVTNRPHIGLGKLVLYSTLPSTKRWNDEHLKMIDNFPSNEKETLIADFEGKTVQKPDFIRGLRRFYDEHVGKKSQRKYIPNRKRFPKTNKEIYEYMWGKSELFGTGTLKEWTVEENLCKIDVPTLILNGELDESTIDMNKFMHEQIKGSTWYVLPNCHHSSYNELPDEVLKYIEEFIR